MVKQSPGEAVGDWLDQMGTIKMALSKSSTTGGGKQASEEVVSPSSSSIQLTQLFSNYFKERETNFEHRGEIFK